MGQKTATLLFIFVAQLISGYCTDYIVITDQAKIYYGDQVVARYPKGAEFTSFEQNGDWVLLTSPKISGWIASSDLKVKTDRRKPPLPTAGYNANTARQDKIRHYSSRHTHGSHATHHSSVHFHRDTNLGYELSYPSTWNEKPRPGSQFLIDRILRAGEFGTLSVDVSNYTGNPIELKNLLSFKNGTILLRLTKDLKKRYPNYKVVDHNSTHLGDYPAYFIEANYALKNYNTSQPVKNILIVGYYNNKLYRINFEARGKDYTTLKRDFDTIIATFNYL